MYLVLDSRIFHRDCLTNLPFLYRTVCNHDRFKFAQAWSLVHHQLLMLPRDDLLLGWQHHILFSNGCIFKPTFNQGVDLILIDCRVIARVEHLARNSSHRRHIMSDRDFAFLHHVLLALLLNYRLALLVQANARPPYDEGVFRVRFIVAFDKTYATVDAVRGTNIVLLLAESGRGFLVEVVILKMVRIVDRRFLSVFVRNV